jgi:hypothetical protein
MKTQIKAMTERSNSNNNNNNNSNSNSNSNINININNLESNDNVSSKRKRKLKRPSLPKFLTQSVTPTCEDMDFENSYLQNSFALATIDGASMRASSSPSSSPERKDIRVARGTANASESESSDGSDYYDNDDDEESSDDAFLTHAQLGSYYNGK